MNPRATRDTEVRREILLPLPGIEPRSPCRPVRSHTLYCLSYPAPSVLAGSKYPAFKLH
jgi:hypothetical protein